MLRKKFKKSSSLPHSFLLQRSKANWTKYGNECTKYFFSIRKQKKLMQSMTYIKNDSGEVKNSQEDIATVFVKYYQHMLDELGNIKARSKF